MPKLAANPTLATVAKVQAVLEKAEGPLSRYQLHKRLRGSVNHPVLDAVLEHFHGLGLIADEGKGGGVLWIHNTRPRMRELARASRRVA